MILESLLAYAHFIAILSLVVFLTSEAALCRAEWMNAAVVRRLARLDFVYMLTAIAVLATGIARTVWGIKGAGWYWSQPLLYTKLALFVAIGLLSIKPTLSFTRWRRALDASGALPSADEVSQARRWVMIEAHLLILVPLAAVFLARGVAAR
jgi:putative membrane protein